MEEVGPITTVEPKPGYVIKTRILKSNSVQIGTKVFINVCQDSQVPKPSIDFDAKIVFPLIVDNQWEIPIIVSVEKEVKDKLGVGSFCYDCCINDDCFRWCTINSDLKSILNEWCLEAIEMIYNIVVDRQYSIPKMMNKGPLSNTEIKKKELTDSGLVEKIDKLKKNETLGLIEELGGNRREDSMDVDDDVSVDIFNNNPQLKRPLIQEIDEPIRKSSPSQSQLKSQSQSELFKTKIEYSVNFTKLQGPYTCLVKLKSNLPYESTQLFIENNQLIITSNNPNFVFESDLKIPIPESANTRSFYVNNELLIFC